MRPLGRHDVTLRHPEFGERAMSVVIRSNQPARVSADMRPTP
jgi:hypothetical protein